MKKYIVLSGLILAALVFVFKPSHNSYADVTSLSTDTLTQTDTIQTYDSANTAHGVNWSQFVQQMGNSINWQEITVHQAGSINWTKAYIGG